MKDINLKVPEYVKKIISGLEENGFEGYMVGGCVRDQILGKEPEDFDIATDALPEKVKEIFSDMKVYETGIEHGTVTVIQDKNHVEVTTYRVESSYKDNRRPDKVDFTSSLQLDLSRRDFTVNSLAYSPGKGLVDLFGGLSDIKNKIIRAIGNPKERFKEDYLRILRGIRFSSCLGFKIEKETLHAMEMLRDKILYVAAERIKDEFSKTVCGDYIEKTMLDYRDYFGVIIPPLKNSFDFDQQSKWHDRDVYGHTVKVVSGVPGVLHLRLAAVFHDIGKPFTFTTDSRGTGHFYGHVKKSTELTRIYLERYKFDKETSEKVIKLVKFHDVDIDVNKKALKKFASKHGVEFLFDLISLKEGDIKGQNSELIHRLEETGKMRNMLREIVREGECFSLKDLALNGDDLIEMGYRPGKKIGIMLNDCLNQVIEGNIKNSCDGIKEYVIMKYR